MRISDLEKMLLEEGCNPDNFCIGPGGAKSDVFCLNENYGTWQVYYTERGSNSKPIYESRSEKEACQFYINEIMSFDHWHIVGFFETEESAKKMEQELRAAGIEPVRNDMPPLKAGGPNIKRVFVVGKQIFQVRKMYEILPVKHA